MHPARVPKLKRSPGPAKTASPGASLAVPLDKRWTNSTGHDDFELAVAPEDGGEAQEDGQHLKRGRNNGGPLCAAKKITECDYF